MDGVKNVTATFVDVEPPTTHTIFPNGGENILVGGDVKLLWSASDNAGPIGTVDLYLTTHHGMNISNSPAIVQALHPRVAVMNNGARKGGSPEAWQVVHNSPGLQDIWQVHYAMDGGKDHNSPEAMIANIYDKDDEANWLKVSADANGEITVYNSRNKFEKTYTK